MHYHEPIFRPPSEAESLLLPVTVGCSRNRCTFCAMYDGKSYREMDLDVVFADIDEARAMSWRPRRAFLLDGDALSAPTDFLAAILVRIREHLPWVERVGVYGESTAIVRKGVDGMRRLAELGLGIVYHGLESGNETVLKRVRKPETMARMIRAGGILRQAGVRYSVMALLGLGGVELSDDHARDTAAVLSGADPDYIGLLTVMPVPGTPFFEDIQAGRLVLPDPLGMICELRTILAGLDVTSARFSANHASNYLPLTGNLPADRQALLERVDRILAAGDPAQLKPEWRRGL